MARSVSVPISARAAPARSARRWAALPIALVLLVGLGAPAARQAVAAPPPADALASFVPGETEHFRFFVQTGVPAVAERFVKTHGPVAELALKELSAVFGVTAPAPIEVYAYESVTAFEQATQSFRGTEMPDIDALADPVQLDISLALPRADARSPREIENAFRHATAHLLVGIASSNRTPRGFAEGIAQYVERPINPQLVRLASVVQAANARGGLLSWSDLNRPQPSVNDPELLAAEAYAVTAFLIERFELRAFRAFLGELYNQPDWRAAMRTAYNRSPDEIERQWREEIPQWVAGGWKNNVVAALDLEPAQTLLSGANYAAAKALLERSQVLYTDLGDQEQLAVIAKLVAACDTGLQAEALMTQTQQALEHHTYDRAHTLLAQARAQYEQLPEDQRPADLLDTYERLAATGVSATQQLDEARRLSHNWGDYPEARSAAVDAGTAFAQLGDEDMLERAQALLQDLDARQQRLVLLLGALGILTLGWLGLWLWTRGRPQLDWS